MNPTVLIDAILRQTTVLVAELATSRGLRAPLSHIADQVFLELSRELEAQGLSRKVSADMFGMALRTYQRKVQRLRESGTARGRTLWDAVYEFIRARHVVRRREIKEHFVDDDEVLVRGVLNDLVESGLVFATGPTQDTSFRAATEAELGAMSRQERVSDELIWALVFRTGPATASSLSSLGGLERAAVDAALDRLVDEGRVERQGRGTAEAGEPTYRTTRFFVPLGEGGWEAAIFDHYHAVVRTIVAKVRTATGGSDADDSVGGSTYGFEVWEGHPLQAEVLGYLRRLREELSALRERVRAYNRSRERPRVRRAVVIYGGQSHWEIEDEH